MNYSKEEANNQVSLWAWGGGRVALEPASPEPLFDQRGRHQVSSAKDQGTQLVLWIVGALGEIACVLLLGRVCISGNELWLREGPWRGLGMILGFFPLTGEEACQFTKIWGLSNYCVLVWALHLEIKTWPFPVF